MRIVVTGKTGQLARSLLERAPEFGATVLAIGRPELDLADTSSPVEMLLSRQPDLIVSAAAYTAVDKAESEPELAFAVNAEAPRRLASVAAARGIPVIHISTDYVFDGGKTGAWREEDPTAPLNVYGASKLAGEKAVLAASSANIVLRVGWVYSPFGSNFAKTILRLAGDRDLLRVVDDQSGGPTSALDIAGGILMVAKNIIQKSDRTEMRGLFHMGSAERTTWAGFAEGICEWLGNRTGKIVAVERITSKEFPAKAERPANSYLDSGRLAAVHGIRLPSWRASLSPVLERLALSNGR